MTEQLDTSDRRRAGALIAGAAAISALSIGALAYTATNAAFSATTDDSGNSFTAAEITLTDDNGASAMFNVTEMLPGDSETSCIEVTYAGSPVGADLDDLKLYGTIAGGLADDLDLTVERSAAAGSCGAFVSAATVYSGGLDAIGADYANGESSLIPTGNPETVAYRFTVTLDAATPNTEQGENATADFIWEVQTA